ncbi:MAG: hypothetical protein M1549_00555, partial [Candidatus Dependentiae bacterium]|nr:hypothetical protein [Candidatus Dependentiae bacterium]
MKHLLSRTFITDLLCISFLMTGFMPVYLRADSSDRDRPLMSVMGRFLRNQGSVQSRAPRDPIPLNSGTGPVGAPAANANNSVCCPLPKDVNIQGDLTIGGTCTFSHDGVTLPEDPVNGQNALTLEAAAAMPADYTLRFPPTDGLPTQRLATDGLGNLYWDYEGGGKGFVNGGNAFGIPAVLGTTDNNSLTIRTGTGQLTTQQRMIFAAAGGIAFPALTGTQERYLTVDGTGTMAGYQPVGVQNTVQVIIGYPVVEGKYYPDLMQAIAWADENAEQPTTIELQSGTHEITSTIQVTNPQVRSIQGIAVGGAVVVPAPGFSGPMFKLSQTSASTIFSMQNLTIDGSGVPGYMTTPGNIGISVTGAGYFGIYDLVVKGCYQGIVADAAATGGNQEVVLTDDNILFCGDTGLICDNGTLATVNDLIVAWSGTQEVLVRRTDDDAPFTEVTFGECWLSDTLGAQVDGLVVEDVSQVYIDTSRVYNVNRAFVAKGNAILKCASNTHVSGTSQHYAQLDGTAEIQVMSDLVEGTDPSKFIITDSDNVYFDLFDYTTNTPVMGRMTNTDYNLSNVLTGHGADDPGYRYVNGWFGYYTGEIFNLPAACLAPGAFGGRGVSTWNSNAALGAIVRGTQAHAQEVSTLMATYASNADPAQPDLSLLRYWSLDKKADTHELYFEAFDGQNTLDPVLITQTGNVGLNSLTPTSHLEVNGGQVAVSPSNPQAPAYSFLGNLNTGLYNATSDGSLGLTLGGATGLSIATNGQVTVPNLHSASGGVVHASAAGLLSSSLVVGSDIQNNTIPNTKLMTISTPGKVLDSATTATSLWQSGNPASIVERDTNGNFTANVITASLNGNAATATSAGSFSGQLSGDVTGTQTATTVAKVGGQSATSVANGVIAANAATSLGTANTIVKRDGFGNFAAGTITANLSGNATTATMATNFSGPLSGDVTGPQGATVVSTVGGQSAAAVANAAVAVASATSAATPSTLVLRDASNNFSAGTITASLTGHASLDVLKSGDSMSGPLTMLNQQAIRLVTPAGASTNFAALTGPDSLQNGAYTVKMPTTIGLSGQVLSTDALGGLYWQSVGTPGGYFINGGNAFAAAASLGTTDNNSLTIRTGNGLLPAQSRMVFAADGTISVPSFTGTGDRYVQASSTGVLSSQVPVGTMNVIYVMQDSPEIEGKYYPTIQGAIGWANANAQVPTSIWIEAGYFPVTSTLQITNNMIRSIRGESLGATVIVPAQSLAGQPVFLITADYYDVSANQTTFSMQDFSINGLVAGGYGNTSGSIGINIAGSGRFGIANVLVQGCYQGVVADAATVVSPEQQLLLLSCSTILNSTDCGLLVDNGANANATDLAVAFSVNQEIRVQRTSTSAPTTQLTLISSWLMDNSTSATSVGLLATDVSNVVVESSRIYDVQNALVVDGSATLESVGNLRIDGIQKHYVQNSSSATIQATGDVVTDASPTKFSIANNANVYFDIMDTVGNVHKIGNLTNESVPVFSILTGADGSDPAYGYKANWLGYRGELFEMPEASMVGSNNAGRALSAVNNNAFTISFVRGLQADQHDVGMAMGTYNSDLDPGLFPDFSKLHGWIIYKSSVPQTQHSLFFSSCTEGAWKEQIAMTPDAQMGIGTTQPLTRLQLGSGQLSAERGSAPLPTYTFVDDLDTGLYSPGPEQLAFSTAGTPRLTIGDGTVPGVVSIANLATAGVVHNDATGKLSTSLITNADVAPSAGIADTKLATIQTAGKVADSATTATSAWQSGDPASIVERDATGNFTANVITADLNGNAATATSAGSFSGQLYGDVTGTQAATTVAYVDHVAAAAVASGATAANNATSSNTSSAIIKRDASGNFAAGTVTANLVGNAASATTAISFTGFLSGDVTGTQSATVVSQVGGVTAANVAAGASAANAATNNNTVSTIVKRDSSGNFAAGTITA